MISTSWYAELIELGIPKLELKRTNDVPGLLIQI
jgi:hypothetical protein